MSICQSKNITKSYHGKCVIKDINIELKENELVALVGTSGIGKTTIFNIISGLLLPDSGEVFFNGANITGKPGSISYMQQKDLLLPYKTVIQNASLPLIIKGMKKSLAEQKVFPLFDEFGLTGCENKYPAQLSGGMRQRAALLRTYMFDSDVILLDEPFNSLDAITKTNMYKWYTALVSNHKKSTMIITHDIDEALFLADRIYIMSGSPGQIVSELKINKKNVKDFNLSKEFLDYKRQILKVLNKDVCAK